MKLLGFMETPLRLNARIAHPPSSSQCNLANEMTLIWKVCHVLYKILLSHEDIFRPSPCTEQSRPSHGRLAHMQVNLTEKSTLRHSTRAQPAEGVSQNRVLLHRARFSRSTTCKATAMCARIQFFYAKTLSFALHCVAFLPATDLQVT